MATTRIPGCEGCEHFNEVWLDEGTEHRQRRYCGLGNFNIDMASFAPRATSHNKCVYERQNFGSDSLEFGRPVRCPLKGADERKTNTKCMKENNLS